MEGCGQAVSCWLGVLAESLVDVSTCHWWFLCRRGVWLAKKSYETSRRLCCQHDNSPHPDKHVISFCGTKFACLLVWSERAPNCRIIAYWEPVQRETQRWPSLLSCPEELPLLENSPPRCANGSRWRFIAKPRRWWSSARTKSPTWITTRIWDSLFTKA